MAIVDVSIVLRELGISGTATADEQATAALALKRAEGAVKRHLRYDPQYAERTEYYPQQSYDSRERQSVWEVQGNQAVLRNVARATMDELIMWHIPIRSVASLYIDYDGRSGSSSGAFSAEMEKVEGTDFWPNWDSQDSSGNKVCMDGILRSIGNWPTTPGTVKVTYTAGYTSAELQGTDSKIDATPIYGAILTEALRMAIGIFSAQKRATGGGTGWTAGAVQSERLGDYSYSLGNASGGSASSTMYGGLFGLMPSTKETLTDFIHYGWAL